MCYVINGELASSLPSVCRAPDGSLRTGLTGLTDAELAEIGIYKATVVKPVLSTGQYYGAYAVEIDGDSATVTYSVLGYSAAEIAGALEKAKNNKRAEIAAARWREMSEPATVVGYDATWYADKESLDDMNRASTNLQRAIALEHVSADATVDWKTADGTFQSLTLDDLITVELLLSQRQQTLYSKEAELTIQIDAAQTPEELEAITWSMQASS